MGILEQVENAMSGPAPDPAPSSASLPPPPPDVISYVTPGQVAGQFGGTITDATMTDFLNELKKSQALNDAAVAAEVSDPEHPDSAQRETAVLEDFFYRIGRMPDHRERAGPSRANCAACGRMQGQPCDEHMRRPGTPIAYPPHPWPSDAETHVPGTGQLYNVLRSVR